MSIGGPPARPCSGSVAGFGMLQPTYVPKRSRQGLAWNTVGERTLLRVREAISEGSPRQLRPGSAEKHAQDGAEGLSAHPLLNEEYPLRGWRVAFR